MLTPTFELGLSPAAEHLWRWFCDLHQGRQTGLDGFVPLSWADMASWASLTRTNVRPVEWRIIRSIDVAYLAACHELAAQGRAKASDPNSYSERPMSPELWDAIF